MMDNASVTTAPESGTVSSNEAIVSVEGVSKKYKLGARSLWRPEYFLALKDVSFQVMRGEVMAIIGESGSGKSTLARILIGLVMPTSGNIEIDGLHRALHSRSELWALHRKVQLIQQDSRGSLDPRMTVGAQICEPLAIHRIGTKQSRLERCVALLEQVGLSADYRTRLPHMLSGGQRQRVSIARALALEPDILVCDEPVSALDVTVQRKIVDLLMRIREERNVTMLFITHDLKLAGRISDHAIVMRYGEIVERGPTRDVLENPRHTYTQMLVQSARGRFGDRHLVGQRASTFAGEGN